MTHDDMTRALLKGWPDAVWTLNGEDWESADWQGPGEKPSLAELEAVELPAPEDRNEREELLREMLADYKALRVEGKTLSDTGLSR